MTASEIAALIGAAAWAPQIAQWVSKALKRPKLEMFAAPTVVLGYNLAGPMIYLAASVSSQNRDVIITNIKVVVQHESKEERLFTWTAASETLLSLEAPTGERLPMSRKHEILAIKAITETLTEKYLTFYDAPFRELALDKLNKARQHFRYIEDQVKEPTLEIIHSKELKEVEQFLLDSAFWREGSYRLEFQLFGKGLKSPHREQFEVTLTRLDVETLADKPAHHQRGLTRTYH